jgi:hypothetical protein
MGEHVTQDKLACKRQQHDQYASLWQYRAGTVIGQSGANQRSVSISKQKTQKMQRYLWPSKAGNSISGW